MLVVVRSGQWPVASGGGVVRRTGAESTIIEYETREDESTGCTGRCRKQVGSKVFVLGRQLEAMPGSMWTA